MSHFLRDLRFAARMPAKAPGFTAVAALCLALGIGVNSTVFSLVDGYWTRPLPVPHAQQLVYLYTASPRDPQDAVSFPQFLEYQARARSFSGLLATERRGGILTGPGFADAVQSNVVSSSYFQVLGIAAQAGRVFNTGDAVGSRVLVMSHNLWQRRFGGDPSIVGRTIRINGLYTVIGIAPAGFRGVEMWRDSDVWIPQSSWDPERGRSRRALLPQFHRDGTPAPRRDAGNRAQRTHRHLRADGAGLAEIQQGLPRAATHGLRTAAPVQTALPADGHRGTGAVDRMRNVAGLLLARAGSRTYEMGVRVALGASRRRLVSQLMAESGLIGAMGAGAGLLLARVLISLLPAVIIPPAASYLRFQFRLDTRVLAFTLAASLITIFVFGLAPAMRTAATVPRTARRAYSRRVLVVAQMVLSIVLLSGAGLLVRTFTYCMNLDPGFTRSNVLVAEISPPYNPAGSRAFYGKLMARAPGIPGVVDATLALRAPLSGSGGGMAQNITIAANPPQRVPSTPRWTCTTSARWALPWCAAGTSTTTISPARPAS